MMVETVYITHNTCFPALPETHLRLQGEERKKNLWQIKENE